MSAGSTAAAKVLKTIIMILLFDFDFDDSVCIQTWGMIVLYHFPDNRFAWDTYKTVFVMMTLPMVMTIRPPPRTVSDGNDNEDESVTMVTTMTIRELPMITTKRI